MTQPAGRTAPTPLQEQLAADLLAAWRRLETRVAAASLARDWRNADPDRSDEEPATTQTLWINIFADEIASVRDARNLIAHSRSWPSVDDLRTYLATAEKLIELYDQGLDDIARRKSTE
jgi:hypothetical protein